MRLALDKLFETESALSGKIEVWQDGVERKLVIGGATQSIYRVDGSERGYWLGLIPQEKVWHGLVPEEKVGSALILGLGGGTAAQLLRRRNPEVAIVAYEIDPEVVRVARSYFALDPQTEVRVDDLRQALTTPERYDLVVVDAYTGHQFAEAAEEPQFLAGIRSKLNPGGWAAFNRIPSLTNRSVLRRFEDNLREVFSNIIVKKADLNLIFWARQSL